MPASGRVPHDAKGARSTVPPAGGQTAAPLRSSQLVRTRDIDPAAMYLFGDPVDPRGAFGESPQQGCWAWSENVGGYGMCSTLKISKLPSEVTCGDIMRMVDEIGFGGRYDFVYVPRRQSAGNVFGTYPGYMFINLTDPASSSSFAQALERFRQLDSKLGTQWVMQLARVQGVHDNVAEYGSKESRDPLDPVPVIRGDALARLRLGIF